MPALTRRELFRAAGGAGAALLLAGCAAGPSPSASKPPLQPVKAAWVARTAGQTLWPLAKEAGYFEKYGLNVDLQFLENSTLAIPAMVSGELGPVAMAGAAVVGAQAAGSDLIMIAGLQNQSIFRIMGVSGIDRIEDLKGKTVAVVQIGSNDYYIWQRIMARQGWGQNDLKFAAANSLQGQIALLQRGDAQAIAVSPPNNVLAENQGGHQILDTAALNAPEQNLGVTVMRTYFSANRATCLAMLKATIEAVHRYRTDPTFTRNVIRNMLQSDDQRFIDAGFDAYLSIFPTEPYPTRDGFAETISEIASRNDKAANLKPEQLMDTSLVDELKNSGFIKQVFG
ncbi:MAG TPA: ABC transporter substrate-binding protein [Chloroflexota bacterium]